MTKEEFFSKVSGTVCFGFPELKNPTEVKLAVAGFVQPIYPHKELRQGVARLVWMNRCLSK
jgi:hypothetical protein